MVIQWLELHQVLESGCHGKLPGLPIVDPPSSFGEEKESGLGQVDELGCILVQSELILLFKGFFFLTI